MEFNSLQNLVDKGLLKEQDSRKDRKRSGKFVPSSFGRCYRMQVWRRDNKEESNPIGVDTLRVFAVGKLFHKFLQGFLPDHQTEIKVEDVDVLGFADIVFPDSVEDIKSVRSYGFKKMKGVGYDIKKDKLEYVLQVVWYAGKLGKKLAKIIAVDKDSLEIKEFPLFVEEHTADVLRELSALRAYWKVYKENGTLPPAEPRAYSGNECKYCAYFNTCKKEEDNNATANSKE